LCTGQRSGGKRRTGAHEARVVIRSEYVLRRNNEHGCNC